MPKIGFYSTELGQDEEKGEMDEAEEGEEEGEEGDLFKGCLTEEEAEFDLFAKSVVAGQVVRNPGGVRGLGNTIAASAHGVDHIADLPEDEFEKVKADVKDVRSRFEEGELDAEDVLGEYIEMFGCEPVKEEIQVRLEAKEEGELPFQKRKKQAEAAEKFMPSAGEEGEGDVEEKIEEKLDEKFDELIEKLG